MPLKHVTLMEAVRGLIRIKARARFLLGSLSYLPDPYLRHRSNKDQTLSTSLESVFSSTKGFRDSKRSGNTRQSNMLPFPEIAHFSLQDQQRKSFVPSDKSFNCKLQTLLAKPQSSLIPKSSPACPVPDNFCFFGSNQVNISEWNKNMKYFESGYDQVDTTTTALHSAFNNKFSILKNCEEPSYFQEGTMRKLVKSDSKQSIDSNRSLQCPSADSCRVEPLNISSETNLPEMYPSVFPCLSSSLQRNALWDSYNLSPTQQIPACFSHPGSFLPSSWWRLSNMMLASQLLNSHFIQTVNKSLQRNVSFSQSQARTTTKKRQAFNTDETNSKRFCSEKLSSRELSNEIEKKFFNERRNLKTACFPKQQSQFASLPNKPIVEKKEKNLSLKNFDSRYDKKSNKKLRFPKFSTIKTVKEMQSFDNQEWMNSKLIQSLHHYFPTSGNFVEASNPLSLPNQTGNFPGLFVQNPTVYPQKFQKNNSINSDSTINSNGIKLKEKKAHRCCYCGKLYSRKYGLKIHIRTHTGYKPLKCKICGRPFGDPSNLNKHVRLHAEGATPYRCRFCGKVLVRRRDLERHINSRHPEKKEAELLGTPVVCSPANSNLWPAK